MGYEIEFHPVGEGTKAGDAITIRYGQSGSYKVIVIDGGTQESGVAVVAHIRSAYGPHTVISHVISTHPDTDHCSGLREIIRELPVERLWIHGLWYHAEEMRELFSDKRWTSRGLSDAIRKEYSIVEELIELAQEKNVAIYEPFAGQVIGPLTVLHPTKEFYLHLVPQFRKTPDCNVELLKQRNMWLGPSQKGALSQIFKTLAEAATSWTREKWTEELLKEGAITAAENESCTVLFGDFEGTGVLFTADAGVNGLHWACINAENLGIPIAKARLIQVPHHGSRSNVTPTILNRLLGPILPENSPETRIAIVSAPKDDEKHPRKMVLNAFRRRGVGVRSTQGTRYRYHARMPARTNEKAADVFEYYPEVEAYD